jgi:hypothetical protein
MLPGRTELVDGVTDTVTAAKRGRTNRSIVIKVIENISFNKLIYAPLCLNYNFRAHFNAMVFFQNFLPELFMNNNLIGSR